MHKVINLQLSAFFLAIISLLATNHTMAASNFGIIVTPNTTLPSTVTTNQTVYACYTVTNNTNPSILLQGYSVTGLPSTVTPNYSGSNCPATLAPCSASIQLGGIYPASCIQELDITGPVKNYYFSIAKGYSVTKNISDPLNVTAAAASFAYVANQENSSVSLCLINPDGTFGSCKDSGNAFATPTGIALNNNRTIAYVADSTGNQVSLCPINSDGTFGLCKGAGNAGGPAFNEPFWIAINGDGSKAYVANRTGNSVYVCPINLDGTFRPCVDSGTTFDRPVGITINNTGKIAYVSCFTQVLLCQITSSGLGPCEDSGAAFKIPVNIAINSAGTIAYVANHDNFKTPGAYELNVSFCSINLDGTFGACSDSSNTGVQFQAPVGVVLNALGTIAYVTNNNNNTVSVCPIKPDGNFGDCIDSGSSGVAFQMPAGIVLN